MLLRFPAALAVDNRLGMSLFGSALIHLLVILGVGFTLPRLRSHEGLPTLEITLVQTHTAKAPLDPDFLAQAHQDGGGDSPKRDIARSPLPARELGEQRLRLPTLTPAPQPEVTARRDTPDLFSQDAKTKIARPEPQPPRKVLQQTQPNPGLVARARRDAERAQLNAEISREWQTFQGRPRHKYVNARTQEYRYALYMDAWRAKVERIGNLNYPEEAKRRHLTGSLVLDVALKADGTVASISVLRSSGQKLLDDAAMRIVELASPFAPFTPEMRTETDILHITRTWKFNETVVSAQ
ncbi:MAG: energy transducer TonB [Gammaproteobacteria bacterium]|nr:energy transducer TonB [Gammaproteobacteria bacterium]